MPPDECSRQRQAPFPRSGQEALAIDSHFLGYGLNHLVNRNGRRRFAGMPPQPVEKVIVRRQLTGRRCILASHLRTGLA
jgi:hypothetical protein